MRDEKEMELEMALLQHGTVKRKGELLSKTMVSPLRLVAAVKKFGEPIPGRLVDGEEYARDLFDHLLDSDSEFYGQFQEEALLFDLQRYVYGEIWAVKHKRRDVLNPTAMVALDLRKVMKDAVTAISQFAGHYIKHSPAAEVEGLDKGKLRVMLIEAAEEAIEESFGNLLSGLGLLGGGPTRRLIAEIMDDPAEDDEEQEVES